MRINWKLIIVLILAVAALVVTGTGLRKYHRTKRSEMGLSQGLAAYEAGQWAQAATNLGHYLAVHTDDVEVLIKYGRSQARIKPLKQENLAQAINAYRAVLRFEDNQKAAVEIIGIYLLFEMPAEAELIARRFVQDDPDGQFRQMLATALTRQRKYEEAVDVLLELVSQKPDQVLAFQLLGEIAEKQPELNETPVRKWFDQAVEKNPDSAQAYILRSAYLMRLPDTAAALEDLEAAERCDLSDDRVRLSLAVSWIRQKQFFRAKTHLEAVEAATPSNEDLWHVWAMYAVKTHDPQEMKTVADKGLQSLGAENYTFLPVAAELYIQGQDAASAQECIAKLRQVQADHEVILYLEGLVAMAEIDWATAVQKWQQAIHLGYSSEMAYLNLARVYERIDNRPLAIQTLRHYIDQHTDSFNAHLRLAELYARQGRWREASEQSLLAAQIGTGGLEARLFYLRCQIEILPLNQDADKKVLMRRIQKQIQVVDSPKTRMLLFRLAFKLKEYELARTTLDQIEKQYGGSEQISLRRAELVMASGKASDGIAYLEEAVQKYPGVNEITRLLALSYNQNNQVDKSRQLLQEAYEKTTDPSQRRRCRLWLAELALLQDDKAEAVQIYSDMAQENASDIFVRRQLMALQYNQVDRKQLQQWIDQIKLAEGEKGWQWKFEQVRLWYSEEDFQRKYSQAVELLSSNLLLNADDQASRILLASCHEYAGNVQLALTLYREAVAGQPDNVDVIVAAVGAMYRAEDYSQAKKLLADAAVKGVWDPRLVQYELQNSLRLGQEDTVVAILERITANSPEDTDARLALALLQIRKGNYDQARKYIQELLAVEPDSIAAAAAMADLYLREQKPQEALKVCDAYLKKHDTLQAHIMRSQLLLLMDRPQDVLENIQTIEKKYPKDTKAILFVARLYQEIGQEEKSMELLNHLLTEAGDDFFVQKRAARVFLDQPSSEFQVKGKKFLEKALSQKPGDIQLRLKKVQLLLRDRNAVALDEADMILTQLVREYPKLEQAWAALGQVSLTKGNIGQAMDSLMRGLSYAPDSRLLLLMKAHLESMRSPTLAVNTLELLRGRYPQDIGIVVLLSQNYRRAGKASKAIGLLQKSLLDPAMAQSPRVKQELIAALWETGQTENAVQLYEQLIQQTEDPSVLLSWLRLREASVTPEEIRHLYQQWAAYHPNLALDVLTRVLDQMTKSKQPDALTAAQEMTEAILKQHPDSASACYAKAMLLHQMGHKEQAVSWYEKTLEVDPSQTVAINNLAWIFCTEKKDYKKALAFAERGLAIAPSYTDLIDTRGVIYMNMGHYKEAVKDFDQCSKMYFEDDPHRTASTFLLGKCLFLLDKKERSLLELLRARDQNSRTGGLSKDQADNLAELLGRL